MGDIGRGERRHRRVPATVFPHLAPSTPQLQIYIQSALFVQSPTTFYTCLCLRIFLVCGAVTGAITSGTGAKHEFLELLSLSVSLILFLFFPSESESTFDRCWVWGRSALRIIVPPLPSQHYPVNYLVHPLVPQTLCGGGPRLPTCYLGLR